MIKKYSTKFTLKAKTYTVRVDKIPEIIKIWSNQLSPNNWNIEKNSEIYRVEINVKIIPEKV